MSSELSGALLVALGGTATALAALRWLRVAQREHYLPGACLRFARRWWAATRANTLVGGAGLAAAAASVRWPLASVATAVVTATGPPGLRLRGRTAKLAWTGRLRRLALLSALVSGAVTGLAAVAGLHPAVVAAAACALGAPAIVDLALMVARPLEARLLRPFLERARQRLVAVSPRVVAVTGSYGKTTTKGYIAHLPGGSFSVVASPASFNNAAGLARSVNEHLATGTQVFIAEMGTYGPGEIRDMCRWVVPEVSVITALGPVHLERMGSIERIAQAKAEILEPASVAVVNIDHPLLAALAERAQQEAKSVWRCSSRPGAGTVSVSVEGTKLRVRAEGTDVLVPGCPGGVPGNMACALAVALALGVPFGQLLPRLESLPVAPHRRSTERASNGALIIDDTYNSNPAGARAALGTLAEATGRRVVVTPGMVELGPLQAQENERFAAEAAAVATLLVVVGRTNAKALQAGARAAGLPTRWVRDRAEAVAWVSANLGPGDAVLYENDLPDHYP